MNWFKKLSQHEYGYWIDPVGNPILVDDYDHSGMAYNIINEKYKQEYRQKMMEDSTFDGDVYNFLYFKNYIRILTNRNLAEVTCNHQPNEGQINSIMQIIKNYNPSALVIDIGNRQQRFNQSNLQIARKFLEGENVNLRTSPIVNIRNNPLYFSTASVKTAAFGNPYGYWISPEGEKYDVHDEEHYIVGQNIMEKKYNLSSGEDPYKFLFSKGYIRVRSNDDYPYVESDMINPKQVQIILDIFKNYPFRKIILNIGKNRVECKDFRQLNDYLKYNKEPIKMLSKLDNLMTFTPKED